VLVHGGWEKEKDNVNGVFLFLKDKEG